LIEDVAVNISSTKIS